MNDFREFACEENNNGLVAGQLREGSSPFIYTKVIDLFARVLSQSSDRDIIENPSAEGWLTLPFSHPTADSTPSP